MTQGIPLGAFELFEPVGKGGMGVVFRGRELQGARGEVAVKFMTSALAGQVRFRNAFVREVQAMARMNHPSIIRVRDFGEVTASTAAELDGILPVGSPYLVMDFFDGQSLKGGRLEFDWPAVRRLLLSLLDALAHAHAMGIIHRDLKPANVLWRPTEHGQELRLTDFGIARALDYEDPLDDTELEDRISGTPSYMAPEQALGQWRDQGPWTDLYSVGVMAWSLVCGQPPFVGETTKVLTAHIQAPLPKLEPIFAVPERFGAWLAHMLSKSIQTRFVRAADAACALMSMQDPAEAKRFFVAELPAAEFPTLRSIGDTLREIELELLPPVLAAVPGNEVWPLPPLPETWAATELPSAAPVDARIGLFGLRTIPLVDRKAERDELWDALGEVWRTNELRAVLIRGQPGCGKSRLAKWLARRGHEVGAVLPLRISHTEGGSPLDGVRGLLSRFFRATGLDRRGVMDRILEYYASIGVAPEAAHHDAFLLADITASEAVRAHSTTADDRRQRHMTLARLLSRISAERPILLWVDDAQWGIEAVRLIRFLAEEWPRKVQGQLRALVVVTSQTVRDSPMLEWTQQALDEIADAPWSHTIDLGPLSPEDHLEFVAEMLGLRRDVAERVAERTEGNPLFAVQLVGDWIEQRLLVAGPDGYAPARLDIELPDDIQETWVRRLDRATSRHDDPAASQTAIWIAALLGRDIDAAEWLAAVRARGLVVSSNLVPSLISAGLATRRENGWSFVHGLLHEAVLELARQSDEFASLHRACLDALQECYPQPTLGIGERTATHSLALGDKDAAIASLMEAMETRYTHEEFEKAEVVSSRCLELMDDAGIDAHDTRRAVVTHRRANLRGLRGDTAGTLAALVQAVEIANAGSLDVDAAVEREPARASILARALASLAFRRDVAGQPDGSMEAAVQAIEVARRHAGDADLALALHQKSMIHVRRGEFSNALDCVNDALAAALRAEDAEWEMHCYSQLSRVHEYRSELALALEFNRKAMQKAREIGDRRTEAHELYYGGELARAQGRLAEARDAYERAEVIYRQQGDSNAELSRMVLIWFAFEEGDYVGPKEYIQRTLANLGDLGLGYVRHYLCLALSVCNAAERDWDHWDQNFDAASSVLDRTGEVHRDLAIAAECAGMLCLASSPERARRALELAQSQWERLGESERASSLLETISELS